MSTSPLRQSVDLQSTHSKEEDKSLIEESRQSLHGDKHSLDQSNNKVNWLSSTSLLSTSLLPAWFRGESVKGEPLLPMPVQDGSEEVQSRDAARSMWLLRLSATLLASCLVALIWLIVIAGYRPPIQSLQWSSPPSTASLKTNTKTYSLEESVYNETLGFEKIFVINMLTRYDQRDALTLTGSAMGMKLDFVEGVIGADMSLKGLPDGADKIKDGGKGDWRSNMNILQHMVRENINSALILEDDADFDVRLHMELDAFASASRSLVQPRTAPYSMPENFEVPLNNLPSTVPPTTSPYGDNWDILWLGHCGANARNRNASQPIIYSYNDSTVPHPSYIHTVLGMYNGLTNHHPPHTRLYDFTKTGICSQAIAVSLRGAKRLLHEASMERRMEAMDYVLNDFCGSKYRGVNGGDNHVCITTQPSMFTQFKAAGDMIKDSNINKVHAGKMREKASSAHTRLSARMNLPELFRVGVPGKDADLSGFYDAAPDPVVDGSGVEVEGTTDALHNAHDEELEEEASIMLADSDGEDDDQ